jgi:hypothetical protein
MVLGRSIFGLVADWNGRRTYAAATGEGSAIRAWEMAVTGTATYTRAKPHSLASSSICIACQLLYQRKERCCLADEQPVSDEGIDSRHRATLLY